MLIHLLCHITVDIERGSSLFQTTTKTTSVIMTGIAGAKVISAFGQFTKK
jgi:hypothetical protein